MDVATGGRRICLLNPNSTAAATDRMAAIARATLGSDWTVETSTTPDSPAIIVDEHGLRRATAAVVALFEDGLDPLDGVIVSAFLDPGVTELKALLAVPVVGIAGAAMAEAARHGRFAIASTTPDLDAAIGRLVAYYGYSEQLAGIHTTKGDPHEVMGDPVRLEAALETLVREVLAQNDVSAIVIGGGPLADAARALAARSPVPIIEPVPAAARALARLLAGEET
ncbi:MAG: aspartate/glutamate racemase family protein [Alphaproteobacteria bacterium]|nr:aspartate/glutamate racemase family protein [Alphaproteobacteria bacterium]